MAQPYQLNFVEHGTPISDATSLFLANAQAAAKRRMEQQRLDEDIRLGRADEERKARYLQLQEEGFRSNQESEARAEAEKQENARYKAFSDFTRLSDENSPEYDPAAAALIQQRYGLQRSDEQAQLPDRPQEDPRLGQQRQSISQMQATEAQQRAAGPDQYADPDAAGAFSPAISDDLNRARGQLARDEAAYAKQVKDWEALPRTTGRKVITDADGRSFTYDPKAREAATQGKYDAAAKRLQDIAATEGVDPTLRMALSQTAPLVKGRIIEPGDIDAWISKALIQNNQMAAAELRAKTQVAVAQTRKRGGGGGAKKPAPTSAVFGPGGVPLATTGDPKADKAVNDEVTDFRALRTAVQGMRDSYAKGRVMPGSPEAQRREQLAAEAKVLFNKAAKLGALAKDDLAIIEDVVSKGAALYLSDPTPRIEQFLGRLDETMVQRLDSRGLPGAQLLPRLMGNAPTQAATGQAPSSAAQRLANKKRVR